MQTLLVTGGAGFIGSEFVRSEIEHGDAQVVVLDKLTYAGHRESLASVADHPRLVFVEGDIADGALVARLLREHAIDAIVHFAAESHVDRSIDAPAAFVLTNVVGTATLLEAARDYWIALPAARREAFRFLHVSTDEVYGSLGAGGEFTEASPYRPSSPYAASKAAGDHFARAYHRTYGLPVLVTNSSNHYGPYQFPEKLVPLVLLNALEGKRLPVYGRGENVRDWLFVADGARAIRAVLAGGSAGESYHIGGNCERTNLEVVQAVCAAVDRAAPGLPHAPCESLIEFVADRPGHDFRYALDTTKIERELGWRPQIDFETGLAETVRWYLKNSDWVEAVTRGKYNRQRLGQGKS